MHRKNPSLMFLQLYPLPLNPLSTCTEQKQLRKQKIIDKQMVYLINQYSGPSCNILAFFSFPLLLFPLTSSFSPFALHCFFFFFFFFFRCQGMGPAPQTSPAGSALSRRVTPNVYENLSTPSQQISSVNKLVRFQTMRITMLNIFSLKTCIPKNPTMLRKLMYQIFTSPDIINHNNMSVDLSLTRTIHFGTR